MERDDECFNDCPIDLGSVTEMTKGPGLRGSDSIGQEEIPLGLSDD